MLPVALWISIVALTESLLTFQKIATELSLEDESMAQKTAPVVPEEGLALLRRREDDDDALLQRRRGATPVARRPYQASSFQELYIQGIANVTCGFFGSMGGCAMIGQSMILRRNVPVKRGHVGRFPGILAALFVFALTMYPTVLGVIPVAALVGVMLLVSFHTFEVRFFVAAWRSFVENVKQKKARFRRFALEEEIEDHEEVEMKIRLSRGESIYSVGGGRRSRGSTAFGTPVRGDVLRRRGRDSAAESSPGGDEEDGRRHDDGHAHPAINLLAEIAEIEVSDDEADPIDEDGRGEMFCGRDHHAYGAPRYSQLSHHKHLRHISPAVSPRVSLQKAEDETDDEDADDELPPMTKLDCLWVVAITAVIVITGNLAYGIVSGAIVSNLERWILPRKPWEDSEYFEREHVHGGGKNTRESIEGTGAD